MKTGLLSMALAVALAGSTVFPGTGLAADRDDQTWSIVVHLTYADGSEYDYPLAAGVPTREIPAYLADCGASHRVGSVVLYHCYAIPE